MLGKALRFVTRRLGGFHRLGPLGLCLHERGVVAIWRGQALREIRFAAPRPLRPR